MIRSSMLAGMSVLAFAASAGAQTTTTTNGDRTDASTNNRVVVSCTVGTPANSCSVTQNAGTFDSTGSVNANGNGNTSTVNQTGNRQLAENRATGDRNTARVFQAGFANTSLVSQSGTTTAGNIANSTLVVQGTAGNPSSGNNNIVEVAQTRTAGAAAAAGGNAVDIRQADQAGGSNNYASSVQNGTNLTSYIQQRAFNDGTPGASFNSATVSQRGLGSFSFVVQRSSGNTARVDLFGGNNVNNNSPVNASDGSNTSILTQTNTQFRTGATAGSFTAGAPTTAANSPRTANSAIVAITGLQNSSSVFQDGVQNTVDVSILNGGAGNTALADSGTNPGTGASLQPGEGGQPNGRPQGNGSTITQTGRGNYAAISSGGRVSRSDGTLSGGAGNISNISQSQGGAAVTATTLNSDQTASTAHRALVYQRGTLDSVTIQQFNNALGGAAGNVTQSGSLADVAQLSFNSTTTVTQTGTNTALVTQGSRTEATGASNGITIDQTDQGDVTTTSGANPGGGFGGGAAGTASGSSRNFTEVVQYGIQNSTSVVQNAVNASATVFQAVGTRANEVLVRQGAYVVPNATSGEQDDANEDAVNNGANARNLIAIVNQTAGQAGLGDQTGTNVASPFGEDGPLVRGVAIYQNGQNLTARADQQGGTATPGTGAQAISNNAILIAQAYSNSSATATQDGTNLSLQIEQRGINTDTRRLNLVTVSQSGDTNAARATQTQNVGASVAGDATAGVPNDVNFPFSRSGANSAEIVIAQSGTGGSATVEQRGKGQYASITQTGTGNVGGILQTENATNAVAVLTQNGTNNTYYIQQDVAGQYIRVTQTGTGNTAAGTSIINGPSGTGNSNADPQTRPAFVGETPAGGPVLQ